MPHPIVMFVGRSDTETMKAAESAEVSAFGLDGLHGNREWPIIEVAVARLQECLLLRRELEMTRTSLTERKLIDRAKGVLMRAWRMSEDEAYAYALLRRKAMHDQKKSRRLASLFERWGIAAVMKPKTKLSTLGTLDASVAAGEVEIGFNQIREISAQPTIELAGPPPPEIQNYTGSIARIVAGIGQTDAAGALVTFLYAPAAKTVVKQRGSNRAHVRATKLAPLATLPSSPDRRIRPHGLDCSRLG